MRARRLGPAAIASVMALTGLAAPPASEARTTALSVEAIGPGRTVTAGDGRVHVDYDLLLTNAFVGDVTLRSLTVRSGHRVLQRLAGARLAAHTHPILREQDPVQVITPSSTVMVLIDVTLPRGATPPRRLTHRITYTLPKKFPPNAVIESRTVPGPAVRVARHRPLVIPSPLRGPGWWVGGGCCDPDQRHRGLLLANDGRLVPTEMFDIDWLQLSGGRLFTGDGKKLTDYAGYGARIHSVSRGRVIRVVDDKREAPLIGPNPDLDGPGDFAGNTVIVRMTPHRYVFYAHFQPHSITVREGRRVHVGQVLGRLGNSGNSAAPHLHFGIHDGPDPATSASLPWEFQRYRYEGSGDVTEDGDVPLTGKPRAVRRGYPLNLSSLTLR